MILLSSSNADLHSPQYFWAKSWMALLTLLAGTALLWLFISSCTKKNPQKVCHMICLKIKKKSYCQDLEGIPFFFKETFFSGVFPCWHEISHINFGPICLTRNDYNLSMEGLRYRYNIPSETLLGGLHCALSPG